MKYLSICSGIEAATVAFHPLGWTPLAFCEIEAFPSAVLAHHYPDVPNLGDMTKFREWPEELLAECDMLVGGPPCQAFSVAGTRNSLDDERGNLTLTYVHLIDHIDAIRKKHGKQPIIALYENVPGIYSTHDNAFGCLVGAICGGDAPVETESGKWPTTGVLWGKKRRVGYRTLDAQYFGVAQRRRRCFLLAVPNQLVEYLGEGCCPSEILSIAESLRGDTPPSREKREEVAGTFKSRANSGGMNHDVDMAVVAIAGNIIGRQPENGGHQIGLDESGVSYTLTKTDVHAVAYPINTQIATRGGAMGERTGFGIAEDGEPAYTLQAAHSHAVACAEVGPTIGSSGPPYSRTGNERVESEALAVTRNLQVRRLTPIECARLQGFPDDYLDITFNGKPAADTVKYRALGNSMAVPVMAWIGRRIDKAMKL